MDMCLLNCVPCEPVCQHGLRATVFACQHGLHPNMPVCQRVKASQLLIMYQHANKRAYVPYDVPICLKGVTIFQLGVSTCIKTCQFFKYSSYEMLRKSLYYYYYIKNLTLCLIIVIHIICICIIRKKCIMIHFYASFHIKEKCVEFLVLLFFLEMKI